MPRLRRAFAPASALALLTLVATARGGGQPGAASMVRLLGPHAGVALSATRSTSTLEGLVRLPAGTKAGALGLAPVVDGYGRVGGGAAGILAFEAAHPGVRVEVAPPLHTLLDKAGSWTGSTTAHLDPLAIGTGVLVGVADTGLDVTHPDFKDEAGLSRVAWILDLSMKPAGIYPDLEEKFGVHDSAGTLVSGAVLAGVDIDRLVALGIEVPTDQVGHGTHVTSIAAGNGGIKPHTPYVGIAPDAKIVFARITRDATDNIDNADLVRGVQFLFDRGDAEQKPIAVNLSLGSDFGPHDGSTDWEQVLASYVGPAHPGHALVAAAGNSGSILDSPVHQSVRVTHGEQMRVPITTQGAISGAIEVWVAMRPGAALNVGLVGPDGEWIAPVAEGDERGKNTSQYNAGVINGSTPASSPVPPGSHGAVVVWSGTWPSGTYQVTLEGDGTAELYLEALGDASLGENAGFVGPVREMTVNLPATSAGIIGVGCTVNRAAWTSIDHTSESQAEPVLDPVGGAIVDDPGNPGHPLVRDVAEGEVCWFSSAGPTLTGVPKPEISAPGGIVVAAMSQQALPGQRGSIFTTFCPAKSGAASSERCLQIDSTHGVSQGTSMSAPMVAGTAALLFERDPTLTQDKIVGLLQAGAHPFRGASPYDDQGGPGELDVQGALDALDQTWYPTSRLPDRDASWLTLSASYAAADGSTPLTAILELRTTQAEHRADVFDPTRLQPVVKLNGVDQAPPTLYRRAPGVWFFTVQPPPGLGGSSLTIGATFDGVPIVAPKTVPIAADIWRAEYPSVAKGGCAVGSVGSRAGVRASSRDASTPWGAWGGLGLLIVAGEWRRSRGLSRRPR